MRYVSMHAQQVYTVDTPANVVKLECLCCIANTAVTSHYPYFLRAGATQLLAGWYGVQ